MLQKLFIIFVVLSSQSHLAADTGAGELNFSAFSEGKPFADFTLVINQKPQTITENGEASIIVPAGNAQFTVTYEGQSYSKTVAIVGATRTIVLANFTPGKAPAFDIEEPLNVAVDPLHKPQEDRPVFPLQITIKSLGSLEPIVGAKIIVRGLQRSATTDQKGLATVELPEGRNSLSIIHPQFASLNLKDFDHQANAKPITLTLAPSGVKLEEFVVTAPHIQGSMASLLDDRRLAAEVVDVLGAQQMSRAGDSDAASAIRRVTGMTLQSGKYPFIRGMGGRYVTSLLNGFNLPSPNPSRRVVPLDMFPTGILDAISVLKSSGAERLGEFGGGHILLKTKAIPDEAVAKVAISSSINDGDNTALTYQGGSKDWLGLDDGTRELPKPLADATRGNQELTEKTITNPTGLTAEELQTIGQSFGNHYNVQRESMPLSRTFSASLGNSWNPWEDVKTGFTASALYGDDWETTEQRRAEYQGVDTVDPDYTTVETQRLIKIGASGSVGVDFSKNHSLRSFFSLLRRTTDETEFRSGNRENWDGPFRQYFLKWQEREMLLQQFWGEHQFPFLGGLQLDWRFGLADASLYQPDTREYRYGRNNDAWAFASQKGGNKRNYSELYDKNEELGLDLTQPLVTSENFSLNLKVGVSKIDRSRQGKTRRFGYDLKGGIGPKLLEKDLETILDNDNIQPQAFVLKEITQASDTYIGIQDLTGRYAMLDTTIANAVSVSLGLRREDSQQYVKTFYLFDPGNEPAIARLENVPCSTCFKLNGETFRPQSAPLLLRSIAGAS